MNPAKAWFSSLHLCLTNTINLTFSKGDKEYMKGGTPSYFGCAHLLALFFGLIEGIEKLGELELESESAYQGISSPSQQRSR